MSHGSKWELLSAPKAMQTHTAYTEPGLEHTWAHPIELYFIPDDLSGWPEGLVKVWRLDESNKPDLYSYGVFHFPKTPGHHTIHCDTWTPVGNWKTSAMGILTGNQPRLAFEHLTMNSNNIRKFLNSQTNGTVILEFETILRNFTNLGIVTN